MKTDSKPTRGPWHVHDREQKHCRFAVWPDRGLSAVATIVNSPNEGSAHVAEARANADLIAEAGTVHHETGLTSRQLAEQRKELLEALEDSQKKIEQLLTIKYGNAICFEDCHTWVNNRAAIEKARGEQVLAV